MIDSIVNEIKDKLERDAKAEKEWNETYGQGSLLGKGHKKEYVSEIFEDTRSSF